MKTKVSPPTNYFGGKYGTIGELIASILPEHRIYIEPCGGMAGVLFHKSPSNVEIYNDLDSRIVNLFKCIRDIKKSKALFEMLRNTPFSREVYNDSCKIIRNDSALNDIEIAYHTFLALSLAIQPSLRWNGFRQGGLKYETSVARGFKKKVELLYLTRDRLRDVVIENIPATKLMIKYSSVDTLVYLDPPYLHSTRFSSKDYGVEMDDLDHQELLMVCKQIKSKVIISGYNNDIYNNMLSDWNKVEIPVISAIAASNKSEKSSKRTEVIWTNFKLKTQTTLF